MLAVDTLMDIIDKSFSALDLFHKYKVVRQKKEMGNPFYNGNHYLRLRDPSHPQTRHNESLPDSEYFFHSSLCSLRFVDLPCIANNRQVSRDIEAILRAKLHNVRLLVVMGPDARKVALQVRRSGTSFPISISSSDSERSDDLASALCLSTRGTKVTGTISSEADIMRFRNFRRATPAAPPPTELTGAFVTRKRKGKKPLVDSPKRPRREMSSVGAAELWKPKFYACKLGRDNYSRQVAEVCFESFLEGWLSCLKELGVPKDNLTWARLPLLPISLSLTHLILDCFLSNFVEEEFLNRPDEDKGALELVPDPTVTSGIEDANPTEELPGRPSLYSGRMNLSKTCELGLGVLAKLRYPLCDSCREHKEILLKLEFGAHLELG
ncbi:hypothetical protein Acr_17g0008930 [Actinidia rufa]|uniref:Uncharacterized protein n=1 Tax=Actinidia rufa TaxID=165716 RepID=A0A7J0G3G4_9ERIC|nr:hypothetical protein Acr_17g0008930 [Actinidia rufa]